MTAAAMKKLERDAETGLEIIPLYIDGKDIAQTPSSRFLVRSAVQGKDVFLAESANAELAKAAADAAWAAFPAWKIASGVKRRDLLLKFAALLRAHEADLVLAQTTETSCTEAWGRKNIQLAADSVEELASNVTSIAGSMPQTATPGSVALAFNEPVGAVLSIAP
jgi:acyl-CoA reductase-like NAD-dependent aldehyde dehydrogenase